MNVLDLPGPEFVQLYLVLIVIAVIGAVALRFILRQPGGDMPLDRISELHPLEVAYLARGPVGLIDASIATLVRRGSLGIDKVTRKLKASTLPPEGVTPVEEAVYNAVIQKGGRVSDVRKAVHGITNSATARLQAMGLVLSDDRRWSVRLFPTLLILAVGLLGVAKLCVGMNRHRPIGFLVVLLFVTLILVLMFPSLPVIRTRRGNRLLARMKRVNSPLQTSARRAPATLNDNDTLMAFALYGPNGFTSGPMADVGTVLAPPAQGGSGCGSGGCGSSSGSSCGGGGGCGGCGGGGD